MNLKETIEVLVNHNEWRKGAEIPMIEPKIISEALDNAINLLKGLKINNQNDNNGTK
jgi:hypothetical protein